MAKPDARRFKRVSLNMPAHIVINAVDEFEGRLLNISPGGMALIADTNAAPGDAVIIRVKDLDVIEGTVARTFPDGFAVSFMLSKRRRSQLTEKLILLANQPFAEGLGDRRTTLRHRRSDVRTSSRLADGTSLYVRIIDMSVDGVSVEAPRRPPIGSEIHIGQQCGVVVRHTPRGFVVVYESKSQKPHAILHAV